MSARFIIGRAGAGKTHFCLRAIRERLQADPINGPRLVLLVPEQAGLQAERAILGCGADGNAHDGFVVEASHRAEVLSFQRLAYRVLESVGVPERVALSEAGRVMVLRHLLSRLWNKLKYYRRPQRAAGLFEQLARTIVELIQEAITPEELLTAVTRMPPSDPLIHARMHDLHLIYDMYLAYLGSDRLDPSQYLEIARLRLTDCPWLHQAEVWVDGFASFGRQEMRTLVSLARISRTLHLTLLTDPELHRRAGPSRIDAEAARLFARTERTHSEITKLFLEAGVEIDEPLLLTASPPRFPDRSRLQRIERNLFRSNGIGSHDATLKIESNVQIVELPSPRLEVDYAISQIREWVQQPDASHRYSDVAVIARDLGQYHDVLAESLRSHGIPFFIDQRRSTTHHPLPDLLLSSARIAAEDFSVESVRALLKSHLLPISFEDADELENFLIAHPMTGTEAWRAGDWRTPARRTLRPDDPGTDADHEALLKRVNETQRRLWTSIEQWVTFARSRDPFPTGEAWAVALLQWLDCLRVPDAMRQWTSECESEGNLDRAEEHRQTWRDVMEFLGDVAMAFRDTPLSIDELAELLETGFSGLALGLAPPMIDQVLVGSIERSRHPNVKVAILLGLNDGVFPQPVSEDSILNDDDRMALENGGLRLGSPARVRALEEPMLLYIAATRASRKFIVTYAAADGDGRRLRPSSYIRSMIESCPYLSVERVDDPTSSRDSWDIGSWSDVIRRLAAEFRSRPAAAEDDPALRARWNECYLALRESLSRRATGRRAVAGLIDVPRARLSPSSVRRGITSPMQTSVSRLETYSACPFQYFARYILHLSERKEASVDAVDVGQVHHALLEDFVRRLTDDRKDFSSIGEDEIMTRLEIGWNALKSSSPWVEAPSAARDAYALARARSQLGRILSAQKQTAQGGRTRPRSVEIPFGFDRPGGLPAFELHTPKGRQVLLRGYIDRVDLAELGDELLGVVIDYKFKPTEKVKLDFSEVYHGLSLQLPAYLAVLAKSGNTLTGRPIRPIAALYVGLRPRYQRVLHPSLLSERDSALRGTSRPRGLIVSEAFSSLDCGSDCTGWSASYSVYRKRDGAIGRAAQSDAVDEVRFRRILEHTRTKLGELADGILDGDVAVRPYRLGGFSPCSWCPMGSVCRFEMATGDVRFLDRMKRSEAFARWGCPEAPSASDVPSEES